MLWIACPHCGPRDETEFVCGGQTHIARPGPPERVSDVDWALYLFVRDNPKGVHAERWLHRHGCGQWFNVARDTVTHEIRAVYGLLDKKPSLP